MNLTNQLVNPLIRLHLIQNNISHSSSFLFVHLLCFIFFIPINSIYYCFLIVIRYLLRCEFNILYIYYD
jgi:hypothetical protein